jgi:cytoskeletal protein RodZ
MAEIGATLREARMRQRIDITDMEVRTKIRAKYLRALENEEWDLLPGPTYVRSFLRTYAEALGLDAKLLVEEYKLRSDPLETGELHPIRRPNQRERERRRQHEPRGIPRGAVVGLILAAIVGALFVIGNTSEDPDEGSEQVSTMETETTAREDRDEEAEKPKAKKKPAASRVVRLQIVPTAPVSVCLTNINGEVLVGNEILQPGAKPKTYRSKRFRLVLGNNAATLKINGRTRTLPPTAGPVAYTITKNGRSDLPPERRPTCA